MRNNSYAPHYEISIYSIRELKTGAEPFMVAIIIIIIIILTLTKPKMVIYSHFRQIANPHWCHLQPPTTPS